MRKMSEDAATAFLRALRARFEAFCGTFRVEELVSRSWASATFSGARHRASFILSGPGALAAADEFVATLDEAEFDVRDHILADLSLVSRESDEEASRVRIRLEALTVEDC